MEMITKDLSSTIDFISNLQHDVILKGLPFEDKNAMLSIDNREVRIDFHLTTKEAFDHLNLLFLDSFIIAASNGNTYTVPTHNGIINGNMNIMAQENEPNNYHIKVSHLMDEKWNKDDDYYYRFVLPIKDIFWLRDIHTYCYQAGKAQILGLMEITFAE